MKVSYNWLKSYLDFNLTSSELSNLLTNTGLEVEKEVPRFKDFESFNELVIGHVVSCEKHPNADKLKIAKVDVGDEICSIVCGASNIKKNINVVVAKVGVLITNINNESFKIKKAKIRGEYSFGMICSEFEIGLGLNNDGIMILDANFNNEIGKKLTDVLEIKQDFIFEIGLTPNRTDAFGHIGVCRDIKSFLNLSGNNLKLRIPEIDFKVDNNNLPISISIKDKESCSCYYGLTMENVTVKESPFWLKQKLNSIGLAPVNNIVDITNFILFETGNPLHAFDYDKIEKNKIIVKKSNDIKNFKKLDGQDIELNADDLVISDEFKNLCLAGVIGGKESSVTNDTKNIFLESACFDSTLIRNTSKKHLIQTDASYRFERGVDFGNCEYALKRAAMLIKSVVPGAKISSEIISIVNKQKTNKKVIPWSYQKFKKLIGQGIDEEKIERILNDLDFKIDNSTGLVEGSFIEVPSYRVDVSRDVDIFEEVLRIFGYEKINNAKRISFPVVNKSNHNDTDQLKKLISDFLSSQGFYEIKTNSLISSALANKYSINNSIPILNPSSNDMNVLRTSTLFGALDSIKYNLNRQNNNLLFFEFGNVYFQKNKLIEKSSLDLFFTGKKSEDNWNSKSNKIDIFYVKGVLEKLFDLCSLDLKIDTEGSLFNNSHNFQNIYSQNFNYKLNDEVISSIGSLSKNILNSFSIKQEVFFCSIDWSLLNLALSKKNIKYRSLPKFPKIRRDLALLIDEKVSFLDLKNIAFDSSRNLLKDVVIFDVFRGQNVPVGKKSYALGFIFQDHNCTLTDNVIDKEMKSIYNKMNSKFLAVLRDGEL